MIQEFEIWWIEQSNMFANTVNAMYAYCEETGTDFNTLYNEYYGDEE